MDMNRSYEDIAREEYEANEARRLSAQLEEIRREPLHARRVARQDWAYAMANDLDIIGERVGWLFQGNYGYGAQQAARQAVTRRGNIVAQIGQLIAALEWQCPDREARQAWNILNKAQQQAVDARVRLAISRSYGEGGPNDGA